MRAFWRESFQTEHAEVHNSYMDHAALQKENLASPEQGLDSSTRIDVLSEVARFFNRFAISLYVSYPESMITSPRLVSSTVLSFACAFSALAWSSSVHAQSTVPDLVLAEKIVPTGPVFSTKQFGFGSAVDIDGDQIIVGSASVHVFEKQGANWVETFNMDGFDFTPNASIPGEDVAIDGNTIAFSDLGYESMGIFPCTWVYEKTASGWQQKQVLRDGSGFDGSGKSLDLEGNLLAVGAPFTRGAGDVRVYQHNGLNWSAARTLTPDLNGGFGASIAISNGEVLVSRPVTESESAHMYRQANGTWLEATSFGPDGAPSLSLNSMRLPYFGRAVALHDNLAAISAFTDSSGQAVGASVVYVYRRDTTGTWLGPVKIKEVGEPGYGFQVAINQNRMLVSSPSASGQGRVWVYLFDGSDWNLSATLRPNVPTNGILFGTSLAMSDDRAVISAPFESPPSLYIYDLPAAPILPPQPAPVPGEVSTSCYGDGSGAPSCGVCPCGNNAPGGSIAGCTNSLGTACALEFVGFTSMKTGQLEIKVTGAVPDSFVLLVSGDNQLPVSGACVAGTGVNSQAFSGLRCVGGGLLRHGVRQTNATGDVTSPWPALPFRQLLQTGGTRHFQVIYRDSANSCGGGLNTSNAASATFAPVPGGGR